MAERESIELFVAEAAISISKSVSAADRDAAVRMYQRQLAGVPDELLFEALDRWVASSSDSSPLWTFPRSSLIRQYVAELRRKDGAGEDSRRGPAPKEWTRPSAEFLRLHREVRSRLQEIWRTNLVNHDHRPRFVESDEEFALDGSPLRVQVSGREACPVCGPAGEPIRQEIEDQLARLPSSRPAPSPCKGCDGSKFRQSKRIPDAVEPCPECHAGYEAWSKGEL